MESSGQKSCRFGGFSPFPPPMGFGGVELGGLGWGWDYVTCHQDRGLTSETGTYSDIAVLQTSIGKHCREPLFGTSHPMLLGSMHATGKCVYQASLYLPRSMHDWFPHTWASEAWRICECQGVVARKHSDPGIITNLYLMKYHCILLYHIIAYHIILCYITLHYAILCHIVLYHAISQFVVPCCIMLASRTPLPPRSQQWTGWNTLGDKIPSRTCRTR